MKNNKEVILSDKDKEIIERLKLYPYLVSKTFRSCRKSFSQTYKEDSYVE
jgi:hypothetical protein